jgi:hypothetical protein
MDEVDRVLDDARAALLERDARIAALERVVGFPAPATQPTAAGASRAPSATDLPAADPSATDIPTEPPPEEQP